MLKCIKPISRILYIYDSKKNPVMKNILYVLLFVSFASCLDDSTDTTSTPVDFTAENEIEIQAFLTENNLESEKSASGLHYIIEELGTGDQPDASSTVTVAYRGFYTNGSVFDESNADGISFGLQQVIPGWTEGITYFKEGGNGMLLIPAHLGYGSSNFNGIPGGSVLIFDINLIEIN